MISECIGPRCCRPAINRSASGIMAAVNNRGMFTFRILDVALPDKYPKARCPTAYVSDPSNCLGRLDKFSLRYLCFVLALHTLDSSSLYPSLIIEFI